MTEHFSRAETAEAGGAGRAEIAFRGDRMKTLREILTAQQFEIAGLIRYGMTNRQIMATTGLSKWAVHAHLARIFDRVGCENRTMLAVRYALENEVARKKPNQSALAPDISSRYRA